MKGIAMKTMTTRRWLLVLAVVAATTAGLTGGPEGRWAGTTDMAHGKLALRFELTPVGQGWSARAIVGATDLDADGVPVDSLRVYGDSIRFSFELTSDMGVARVGIAGRLGAERADGSITLASGGIVVDRGTWTAGRVSGVP